MLSRKYFFFVISGIIILVLSFLAKASPIPPLWRGLLYSQEAITSILLDKPLCYLPEQESVFFDQGIVLFALTQEIIHPPKGIARFPDGGIPFVNVSEKNVYQWDMRTRQVKKINFEEIKLLQRKIEVDCPYLSLSTSANLPTSTGVLGNRLNTISARKYNPDTIILIAAEYSDLQAKKDLDDGVYLTASKFYITASELELYDPNDFFFDFRKLNK